MIWVEQQARQISTQLVEGLGRIEAMPVRTGRNILRPFVSEAIRQQSIDEFEEVLATTAVGR